MRVKAKLVERANRLLALGHHYLVQKKPEKALDCFFKAQKIIRRSLWDEKVFASLLNDIGGAYFLIGSYKNSISHLKKSLKMKKKIGDERFTVSTLMNLASSYRANCQYDDSLSVLEEARELAKKFGDKDLAKKVDSELNITNLVKAKRPVFQIADLRIVSEKGVSKSLSDVEYLPNLFKELAIRIENISIEMCNPLEAKVVIGFLFETTDKKITDPYESDHWKKDRPLDLRSRIKGSTPNLAVFYGPNVYLTDKDVKITVEEEQVIKFDSREQFWNIFLPDSYPLGGFSTPMPICERLKFFNGTARIFYWKLSLQAKYMLELWVRKTTEEGPFQFGLLFPYDKKKISVAGVCVEPKDDFVIKQVFLKRIPYTESRTHEVEIKQFMDFSNYREIYRFETDGVCRLEDFDPTLLIETKDSEVLCFEIYSLRKGAISKFTLFSFLKRDLDFRKEVGKEEYAQLIQEVRKLPEKCQRHTTATMCRECATQIKKLCVVNLLGIICDSDILPHHGFEYSDLLIKISDEKRLIVPVLAKGLVKITWKKDQGLTRQLLEKLRDEEVEAVVVAASGQIGNRLRMQLEYLGDVHGKSLIFVTERDLAQFLHELKQLYS